MTTPDPPPMADRPSDDELTDEIVSAYLDGEATPEEAARVESDPALRARLAEMRAVATAVASPVPPPPADARDAAIRQGLAAAEGALERARLLHLDAARERRERFRRGIGIASIAAAVALVLALPVLGDSDDHDESASGGEESGVDSAADRDAGIAAEESTALGAGLGEARHADAGDLGSFDDERELGAALAQRLNSTLAADSVEAEAGPADDSSGTSESPVPADAFDSCVRGTAAPAIIATAVMDGRPVTAALVPTDDGTYDLFLIQFANDTCTIEVVNDMTP